VYLLKQIG